MCFCGHSHSHILHHYGHSHHGELLGTQAHGGRKHGHGVAQERDREQVHGRVLADGRVLVHGKEQVHGKVLVHGTKESGDVVHGMGQVYGKVLVHDVEQVHDAQQDCEVPTHGNQIHGHPQKIQDRLM